jgi:hypothetical protein
MKRLIIIILLALIAAFVSIALATSGFRYHKPSSFDKDQQLVISGKTRHYFILEGEAEIAVAVDGPSKLKVMSRLAMAQGADSGDYSLEYLLDDTKNAKQISHKTAPSIKAGYADKRAASIGLLRTHVLDVPRGKHTYKFRLPQGAAQTVFMRFSQQTNEFTDGTPVIAMTPFEFTSSVDLVTKEESYTYYRVSEKDRIVLKLVGPSTLKVLSRIEYDSNMQGKQKWKVQVLEDGAVKSVYNLSSTKSDINTYRETTNLVPSRAETFYVEIPSGEHVYELKLPENHRSSIFRFLMPKSQLEGE